MATIEVQGIYEKDGNGIFHPLRDNYIKADDGIFHPFKTGDGIKGADGNWYVLNSPGVSLVGVTWDTENLADYKNFDEANDLAASVGKRLPTREEFKVLVALPNEWDNTLKGRWFAANFADLATKDKTKCLFFPALGYLQNSDGTLQNQASYGYYWSSTQYNSSSGYYWYFDSIGSYLTRNNKAYGLSVRCVK